MKHIAIFASGNGSNAQHIAEYFSKKDNAKVVAIYCNNPQAFVIERAKSMDIPLILFSKDQFCKEDTILTDLKERKVDLIILAGFLWLIPEKLVKAFEKRILNIHPALLPKYGGKGMYGMKVHQAVINSSDTESGITIHIIDEKYDEGDIVFQATCTIETDDSAETLAQKIHQLEYQHFPHVIDEYLTR